MKPFFKKLSVLVWLLLLIHLMAAGMGWPAEQDKNETAATLDEVVVTASRDHEEVQRAPAHVTVITSDQIEKSGASTLVDVLDRLEGIHFSTFSGNSSQAQIDTRGFGENGFGRTLILLDGQRMNRPDMASMNWLEIPLSQVDRIEIVRGGNGVLYGDAAVGATIQIITKQGKGKPQGSVSFTGGSYNMHNERIQASGAEGSFSYAANADNLQDGGYRERSKFSAHSGKVQFGYSILVNLDLTLGLSLNKTNFQMPGALTAAQVSQDPRQYQPGHNDDDASKDSWQSHIQLEADKGPAGKMDLFARWGKRDVTTNFTSFSSFSAVSIGSTGVSPKYIIEHSIADHPNKLTAGFDYGRDRLSKDTYADSTKSVKTFFASLEKEVYGFYARDEFNITSAMIFTTGYRREKATIRGSETQVSPESQIFDGEKDHPAEAWEASLTYLLGKKSNIYVKYATVYRYPFLDEQAFFFSSVWTDAFFLDLDKEKGKVWEAGGLFCPFDPLRFRFDVYRMDMEDEIAYVYDPSTMMGRNVNLDKTRHEGLEASATFQALDFLKATGNLTLQQTTFREGVHEGKAVPLVPRFMANLGLDVALPYGFSLRPALRHTGKQYLGSDFDNSAEQLEGYTLYDLFLHWRKHLNGTQLSAFAGVENVSNVKYSSMGFTSWSGPVYYPAPGIVLRAGVSIEFL